MIIVSLFGGLGNQLFQWSFGEYLRTKNNVDIKYDTSWFLTNNSRNLELQNIGIKISVATYEEITFCKRSNNIPQVIWRKFRSLLNPTYKHNIIADYNFNFDLNILNAKHDCHLTGYWQYLEIPKANEILIRNSIQNLVSKEPKFIRYNAIIKKREHAVAVHVRRGDFIRTEETKHFKQDQLHLGYYKSAINLLREKYNHPTFFIFSNDPKWAEESFTSEDVIICDTQDHLIDFFLMQQCNHNIIANSSFSWWASWLNDSENQNVIAPQNWFNENEYFEPTRLIPTSWSII